MVVYLPSPLAQKPVLASFLKGGSEDTLSVFRATTAIPGDFPNVPGTRPIRRQVWSKTIACCQSFAGVGSEGKVSRCASSSRASSGLAARSSEYPRGDLAIEQLLHELKL
jgi:hypothetical protein